MASGRNATDVQYRLARGDRPLAVDVTPLCTYRDFHALTRGDWTIGLRPDQRAVEFLSGTGARPTLQALPDDLRPRFEEEFKQRLRKAYPDRGYGVVLPFRRIFAVGAAVR